jgi:hypothetical protein
MKIIKYGLVSTSTVDKLDARVNAFIELGWQPLGGVSQGSHMSEEKFSQAMVKYDNFVIKTEVNKSPRELGYCGPG